MIELGLLCSEAGVREGDGASGDPLDQALRAGAGAAPPGTDGTRLGVRALRSRPALHLRAGENAGKGAR